ncbi:MAG: hypothetical protein KKB20_06340 [Proteobacteria bacterium]|nr:hypothetical protein [Pseudomonadota bacterium]
MNLNPKEKLSEEEVAQGLRYVLKDGIASQAMMTLTGGAFLVSFALELGASNAFIGYLAALPPLLQFVQLFWPPE